MSDERVVSSVTRLTLRWLGGAIALGLLYLSYHGYRYLSYAKHVAKVDITTEFIPASLCGTEFLKEEVIIEEDLAKFRQRRGEFGLRTSNADYYLAFTVHNDSDKAINTLVIEANIYAPFDKDYNPRPLESVGHASVIFESLKHNNRLLMPSQYYRKCTVLMLNRDYSNEDLKLLRRKIAIKEAKW